MIPVIFVETYPGVTVVSDLLTPSVHYQNGQRRNPSGPVRRVRRRILLRRTGRGPRRLFVFFPTIKTDVLNWYVWERENKGPDFLVCS